VGFVVARRDALRASQLRASQLRASQLRASQLRASQLRASQPCVSTHPINDTGVCRIFLKRIPLFKGQSRK